LPQKRAAGEAGRQDFASEELALPLHPSLYMAWPFWLCRNATDAEDLVQETFLKSLSGFDSFEPGTNFKAWIFRILRNTYLTSRARVALLAALETQHGSSREFRA
jgi:RNA polymerase sigma-70 factor (ECF subfamily)